MYIYIHEYIHSLSLSQSLSLSLLSHLPSRELIEPETSDACPKLDFRYVPAHHQSWEARAKASPFPKSFPHPPPSPSTSAIAAPSLATDRKAK